MNKFNSVAIITVRNSSSRLPNKAIMSITEKFRSIDIVIQRAKETHLPLIIATSTDSSDDIFMDIANDNKIECFRGSLLNKIKRWYDCFNFFNIQYALLLDGDDLCHDFKIGKKAISKLIQSECDIIINPPEIVTGFFTYAISKKGIEKLYSVAKEESTNTDVITKFIEKAQLNIKILELDAYQINKNIRLTLDYIEDLDFFRKLYQNIKINEDGKNVIDFLLKNSDISNTNFFRESDYLKNQEKFNEDVK